MLGGKGTDFRRGDQKGVGLQGDWDGITEMIPMAVAHTDVPSLGDVVQPQPADRIAGDPGIEVDDAATGVMEPKAGMSEEFDGQCTHCWSPRVIEQPDSVKLHPLVTEVQAFLHREAIRNGSLVVAVSGGPDSLALLCALHELASSASIRLIAAHLNHQLRGEESDADQQFVEDFCRHRQWEVCVARLDVRKAAEEAGQNLESIARQLRYQWLVRVAQESSASWIATGHTANDQAETVLHNLIRGGGLRGLRGVARRRLLAPRIEVVRPLLAVPRGEVLRYLNDLHVTARQDSSNLDRRLTRNRIRYELLPALRDQFNPNIDAILGRLAEQAAAACRSQEDQTKALLQRTEKPRAGRVVVLDGDVLRCADRHLVRDLFHLIWEREGWPRTKMDFAAWDRLAELVFGRPTTLDLPGGLHARRRGRILQLHPAGTVEESG
jgi:tRNA(Ile)-lysidine synthase